MHRPIDRDLSWELIAVGGFFTLAGLYLVWRGWSTGNWKAAQGEITEAFMSEEEREDDDGDIRTVFKARIVYKYTVYGKEYEGGTLQRGLFRVPLKAFAQKQIEGYRRGQRVTVYYMPSDPSHAVLRRGAPPSAFILFVAGLVFMFIGYKIV